MPQHYYHRPPTPRQRPSSSSQRQAHTSAYAPPGAVQRSLNETPVQPMYPGVEPYYPVYGEVEASALVPYGQGAPGGNLYGGGALLRLQYLLRHLRLPAVPGSHWPILVN